MSESPTPLLRIAVYMSAHGYGHLARTQNFLAIASRTGIYDFHIRTSSALHSSNLDYPLQPNVVQTNADQLDVKESLLALDAFDTSVPQAKELDFFRRHKFQAIISDALSLPRLLAHILDIPGILITNFTFDNIFQALLDSVPDAGNKRRLQQKIREMSAQYTLAHTIIRLPGHIPFTFKGPQVVDAPMNFRKAAKQDKDTRESRTTTSERYKDLTSLFRRSRPRCACRHASAARRVSYDVHMPDLIGACDAVLGKLGWGTCNEVIGNGYKPFIYVPRSASIEEEGLLSSMQTAHRRIIRLDVKEYENSAWLPAIEKAQAMFQKRPEVEEDWVCNEDCLIQTLKDTLQIALK